MNINLKHTILEKKEKLILPEQNVQVNIAIINIYYSMLEWQNCAGMEMF